MQPKIVAYVPPGGFPGGDFDTGVLVAAGATLGVAMLLAALIDPKKNWWSFTAWRYRNPDAVEPSDAAYSAARMSWVASALVVFALTGGLAAFVHHQEADQRRITHPSPSPSAPEDTGADMLKANIITEKILQLSFKEARKPRTVAGQVAASVEPGATVTFPADPDFVSLTLADGKTFCLNLPPDAPARAPRPYDPIVSVPGSC
ncbi:hypothetical protein GCM10023194_34480 [Planotetraspora phitsanulokensis]|uniref:DUF6199 domain-containing protein n=1 Tax=Planotetraspora phitsanulokensis TaxID=575192 RepID=A0A8J3XHC5_9ACTN|nr:hypothetical protein [Planotetraspora phitsanulokensis]GII36423.1 hypothetical protein Pph01_14260 [Planotetraspora phitsanulokensis]